MISQITSSRVTNSPAKLHEICHIGKEDSEYDSNKYYNFTKEKDRIRKSLNHSICESISRVYHLLEQGCKDSLDHPREKQSSPYNFDL